MDGGAHRWSCLIFIFGSEKLKYIILRKVYSVYGLNSKSKPIYLDCFSLRTVSMPLDTLSETVAMRLAEVCPFLLVY